MSAVSNEMMFEVLKDIQMRMTNLENDMHIIKVSVGEIKMELATMDLRMTNFENRLNKIEKRLTLN